MATNGSWRNKERIAKNTKGYGDDKLALRFPLGGIGTGNVSLEASGRLTDFEFLNHPDKHVKYPFNFFAIWRQIEGEEPRARILEATPKGINDAALGVIAGELPGLPRYDSSKFSCQYPFANIEFEKKGDPIKVSLEAFTPFVPLNAELSGLPGYRASYKVTNTADKPADVSICATMFNLCGFVSFNPYQSLVQQGTPTNHLVQQDGLTGVLMESKGVPEDAVNYATMCIATDGHGVTVKPRWQAGGWVDGAEEFWQDFRVDGELCADVHTEAHGSVIHADKVDRLVGSVASKQRIMPGETKEFNFYYFWHFPNRYGWWPDVHKNQDMFPGRDKVHKNYYAKVWKDAWAAMSFFHKNLDMLTERSRTFADALYASTLSADVIEMLVVGIVVIRSNTVFRLADGAFYGWEGCGEHWGSCTGTCTHVWNYAQTAAFLFPEMERSMRRTEFLIETDDSGEMTFRAERTLNGRKWDMLPAADGQWGSIARVYREWKLSGDDQFLKDVWEKFALAVEFSLRTWDTDGDGVMESQQHNTYDIEFYGVNSLTNSIMYAALLGAAEMAEYLGDERAEAWRGIAKSGAAEMDKLLWDGEYYKQAIDAEELNRYKYQYGDGCLSDMLLGQALAHVYGLGYVLPEDHVRSSARAIYKHNFKPSLEFHESVQRGYVCQDEAGLLLCSWPKGGRPLIPFVYSDEVWTGIEYQVATHLIYEGMVDEALEMVRVIRERHDGVRRSPYNEIECGNHYARSMAGWGILVALSGYRFDMAKDSFSFDPTCGKEDFQCFYSNGKGWGVFVQKDGQREILPLGGADGAKA